LSKYQECRYGGEVHELFKDWTVLLDQSVSDYQGNVTVLFRERDHWASKFCYVDFYYGSCSGCDEWEDRQLTSEQIKEEITKNSLWFSNRGEIMRYIERAKAWENIKL
jgi:hypothetical protein